jgi:hypothetical protein
VRRQQLESDYAATHYRVDLQSGPLTLRIGQASGGLAALYLQYGLCQAAYLTACNPASRVQPDGVNQLANARLERELRALGKPYFHGHAIDPEGHWPAEASFLVLGLEDSVAVELGRRYGQNAIIDAGSEAVPGLRWLADPAD